MTTLEPKVSETEEVRTAVQAVDWRVPRTEPVQIGPHTVGGEAPLLLMAGPCVLESLEHTLRLAEGIATVAQRVGLPFIFKASFDKANRTSISAYRGPGLEVGLGWLEAVRTRLGLCVTTDIHLPEQAAPVAQVAELLQIPAFLCRQTDLLLAAAGTGRAVNLKKGQFLSPPEVLPAVEKLRAGGAGGVLVTERGSSFGYQNLVVDLRGLASLRAQGLPVVFDGTHAVQQPGALGGQSGGERGFVPVLVRGAVAAGVDALFLEVHENPARAPSDGTNMVPLAGLEGLLRVAGRLHALIRAERAEDAGEVG